MKAAHERTQRILQSGPRPPSAIGMNQGATKSVSEATNRENSSLGTPAAEVPLLGSILAGNEQAIRDLDNQLKELRSLSNDAAQCRADGKISFRLLLAKLGATVPDEMTEAEAAAEFLRRADKFAGLVTEWKEALEKFPWDFNNSPPQVVSDIVMPAARNIQEALHGYLGVLTEARWRTGDSAGAWTDWQAMRDSSLKLWQPTSHSSSSTWMRQQGDLIQTVWVQDPPPPN